ncbi:hypothetical protein ACFZBC_37285 [Streptomyces luteogriseus]|uniref:hypothetical protein n=1 Tax=Streptomyces luteogriseus TaxID=68233 RepID=UPI0036EB4166
MKRTSILTAVGLTTASALLAAAPAHAGTLDGSADHPDVLDHIAALNTAINSDPATGENGNANTQADGRGDNAAGQHQ